MGIYLKTKYPPIEAVPKKFAIVKRNEYMVDKSDAVAYVKKSWGGATITLEYAQKKKKKIIMI